MEYIHNDLHDYLNTQLLLKPKSDLAQFYLNWIGYENVKITLNNSIYFGDIAEYIHQNCKTTADIDSFINTHIDQSNNASIK